MCSLIKARFPLGEKWAHSQTKTKNLASVPTFLRRVFASRELIHLVENGLNRYKSDSLTFKMECGVVVGRVESSTRGVAANDKC